MHAFIVDSVLFMRLWCCAEIFQDDHVLWDAYRATLSSERFVDLYSTLLADLDSDMLLK